VKGSYEQVNEPSGSINTGKSLSSGVAGCFSKRTNFVCVQFGRMDFILELCIDNEARLMKLSRDGDIIQSP
jgi:hypothetical protein